MGAIKETEKLDMIVQLEQWDQNKVYDRMGMESEYIEILGIKVPATTIPVKPGRNLAIIIEVAAMNHRQKKMGYNAAQELLQRLGDGFSGFAEGGQGSFLVQMMDEGIVERPGVVIDRASARHPAHHADPAFAHEIGVHFLTGVLEPPHHYGRAVLPQNGVTGMAGFDPAQEIFLKREVECRVEGMIHDPIHAELHKKKLS